ncbi:hypothetical protein TWF694_003307 [Orbilia ellipsospora]|uniref:Alpha/beta hydrolase fold-3 domain-containing protein n=1 Tax=Orbilia ellipsospora TaxID=2528407 RepID=A0AAV9X146_9PEZI
MPPSSKITQDGAVTIVESPSYSIRSRILYFVLRTFYSILVTHLLSKPTPSGHQPASAVPKSLHKRFTIKKREFYDWSVYDISLKPHKSKGGNGGTSDGKESSEIKRRMMYIPGTGFVIPASSEHFKFVTKAFVEGVNAVVTVVLHPLAPKNTVLEVYPKFFELYEQLAASLPVDGELDIGGDSSGGGISLSIVQHLREKGIRLPNRLFMMAPSVDFVQPKEEDMKYVSKLDPLQTVDESHSDHVKWVADTMKLEDPRISPIRGNFDVLRDIKIVGLVGTYDILEPDCRRLVEKLKEQGIRAEWLFGEKMVHCWPLMHIYQIPESKQAVTWIIEKMK